MSNLHAALPPRYGEMGQISLLLQALEQELHRLETHARALADRGCIATADEIGLARWEEDLGLPHRTDLDVHSRRILLQGALDRACTGTEADLRAYAVRLTGSTVQTAFRPETYTLTLTAGANRWLDRYSLQHLLQQRLPLHISARWTLPASAALDETG